MNGAELIAQERERQIAEEGWTPEHDDEHSAGELALAGAIYAWPAPRPLLVKKAWPWDRKWWKPEGELNMDKARRCELRVKELVKAGALIAAEIDRYLRAYDAAHLPSK